MARKDKDTKKPEPPPPTPEPTNNSVTGSEPDDTDSDVVSSSSSDAAPPTAVPTTVTRTLTPHHHHSHTQPEPESESESDDDTPPPPPPPKPTTTTKQPRSKPPTPKRPVQSDTNIKGSEKRPKKDSSSTGPSATTIATPATPGKVLFQRLWSDEDEIVILKGMIEYKEKKGVDPMTHVDDFLDFIKKSLHVADANKAQMMSKVRRLKKRFINAQKKKLTDPHEITAFELSKKIWRGGEEVDEVNHRENGVTVAVVGKEEKKGGEGNVGLGGLVNEEGELVLLGEDREMVKMAMAKMGDGERKEMKKMVEKANLAHLEGYLLRLKVLEVAGKKVLEGIKNGNKSE